MNPQQKDLTRAPTNAPTITVDNRPAYISGINNAHLISGATLIIRFTDGMCEFKQIPYDNGIMRNGKPREIPFSSLTRHDKLTKNKRR